MNLYKILIIGEMLHNNLEMVLWVINGFNVKKILSEHLGHLDVCPSFIFLVTGS